MVTIDEAIKDYSHCGVCVQTESPRFGKHWYFVVKTPAKYFHDRVKFARLSDGSVMDWDSMKDDVLLKSVSVENFHKMGR